jgi:LmbE family N-acetylglucosaminyl deacetylase
MQIMLKISLGDKIQSTSIQVLCLGAHSDDIEIGCGGTILRLIEEYPRLCITWIVCGASGIRAEEAHNSASRFLQGVSEQRVEVLGFRDGYFPYIGGEIKDYFEKLKHRISPDLIFTHYRDDLHQDHRLICELTWNTFRDHLIFEYEIPKYDGDLGSPNLFFQLSESTAEQKIEYVTSCFASQADKHWFSADTFWSLLRLRGVESGSGSKFAEAFYCRKIIL